MGYSHDLNLVQKFPVDDGKRIAVEHGALRAVKMRRIEPRLFMHPVKSGKKLLVKSVGSLGALAEIPRMSGLDLPPGGGMVL